MLSNPENLSSLGHVVVIDDDASVRRSVRTMLERVGYTVSVHEGAKAFLDHVSPSAPAVLLLDMRMPGMTGVELQTQIKNSGLQAPVIFMSGDSRPDEIITAMKQQAFDFLLKPFTAQAMLAVVDRAMQAAQHALQQAQQKHSISQQLQQLTPRELEICKWMVRGYTNKQIAAFDGAAPATIKLHRAHVMEKMGVRTLPELIDTVGAQLSVS
jgi:FixJ family two-component response regulator